MSWRQHPNECLNSHVAFTYTHLLRSAKRAKVYLNSKQIQKILLSLPSSFKRLIIVISDGFFAFLSVWLAFNLRFENLLPISDLSLKLHLFRWFSLVIIFSACGVYKECLIFSTGLPFQNCSEPFLFIFYYFSKLFLYSVWMVYRGLSGLFSL